jgi:hypothetical protein
MLKSKFQLLKTLNEGYGSTFGFQYKSDLWASASVGFLHIWNGFELKESYDIPGYIKGNIVISEEQTKIGLFHLDMKSKEVTYHKSIKEKFAENIASGFYAQYLQYKIDEILHLEDKSVLIVAVSYLPSKLRGVKGGFNGPTNRLLLFNYKDGNLMHVIEENYDTMAYSNLMRAEDNLVFLVDEAICKSVSLSNIAKIHENGNIRNFKPICYSPYFNLSGSYSNNCIQFRNELTLSLINELPKAFEKVNAIFHLSSEEIITAVNDHELQYWKFINKKAELIDEIEIAGTIENIDLNPKGLCFVAVAGQENFIQILSLEGNLN